MSYGFIKEVDLSFSVAVLKTEEALKKQGFSILTRIDVQSKFREKLNIDFPKYLILGACNAQLAYQAIKSEWNIGILLPCNVIVYEKNKGVWIGITKPSQ